MSKTAVYWGVRMKRSLDPRVVLARLKRLGVIIPRESAPLSEWTWPLHARQFEVMFTTPQRRPSKGLRKHARRAKEGKIAP